jgi:hypothetical protein
MRLKIMVNRHGVIKIKAMEVKLIQLEKIINYLPNNNSSSFNFETNQKLPPVNTLLLNVSW